MAYDFNSLIKQADEASNRDKFYTDFEDVDPNVLHQISELTDWMRTKAKGSDVREVIAQLFERTWIEGTKEGNANFEVAKARGRFNTLSDRLNSISTDVSVSSSRLDNLSTLKDGSTTGDAELVDIRAAFNGNIYQNAGTAVRKQMEDMIAIMSTMFM